MNKQELSALVADKVDAGLDALCLHVVQQSCGFCTVVGILGIHFIQKEQVAQMEQITIQFFNVNILEGKCRIGTACVEKRALSCGLYGHDVGVRGGVRCGFCNATDVDSPLLHLP